MFSWLIRQIQKAGLVPKISETERVALEAGTVWVEAELFSGRPDFARLMSEAYPRLSAEEQAFVDGPVEEACGMTRGWDVREARRIPDALFEFLKKHRFFGLLTPKEYGGLGFSALGFSAVISKLGTHSMGLSSVVLIPNSLGPAELILHYGTKAQKEQLLPRLARGDEIPCFALTEPKAGSDAGSLTSSGVLFKKDNGRLAIRLNWNKRYITLAPVATLLGLAFRLYDPENLLGKGEDLGITCGLVATDLPGVEVGRRHDPLGQPFPNGPTRGVDVIVDAEQIIGGLEYAGKGWQMLMESLAAGRAIALPGSSTAGAKALVRGVGAYAALREQFGLAIGKLEGVEEPLARIAGTAYMLEAVRVYLCGAVNGGQQPSVASAIGKYMSTELIRKAMNDGMDILGGKGICRGPRNPFADGYSSAPIAITVEGANILTRTLIVFGQGALRCHPYMQKEVRALEAGDATAFRRALFGHLLFLLRNVALASGHTLTRGLFASAGPLRGAAAGYAKKLKWASAVYAVLVELAVASNGPNLKRRGKIAGRFADALSWMFFGTAVLRRYEAEGRIEEDRPFLDWCLQTVLHEVQKALEGILANFEVPLLGSFMRRVALPLLRLNPIGHPPSDALGAQLARAILEPSAQRDRLSSGIYLPSRADEPFAFLERSFLLDHACKPIRKKMTAAIQAKALPRKRLEELFDAALEKGIISAEEATQLRVCEEARLEVLAVDELSPEDYFRNAAVEVPVSGIVQSLAPEVVTVG